MALLFIILQLTFEAAMDGLFYRGLKTWSKQVKVLMLFCTAAACFFLDLPGYSIGALAWLLGSYVLVRFAIFNPIFNLIAGLKWDYIGTTSISDRLLSYFPLPNTWPFRLFCLVAGISDIIHLTLN
jgi:hypothetical protein